MKTIRFGLGAALVLTFASVLAAYANDIKVGDLELMKPVARATAPGAPVSGGYMTIRNNGAQADRLIGGSSDFAGKIEIHEMTMEGEVMKMREVEGGLEIPAGGEVVLKPGGYHIMFMKLGEQLAEGEVRKVRLVFQKAGEVDVNFAVGNVVAGKESSHSKHGG
ncbi:MAG: copper chaperone PCu(A)C [Rhizobiaceae bacterium]